MEYFKNRRSTLAISETRLNELFKFIVDFFSESWLIKQGPHPLRQLWKRQDELATNELFSLACGIEKFWNVDKKWTREQLQHVKGTDKKQMQGAAFEILGLNMLDHPNHPVTPAKLNLAGYDGKMRVSATKEMRLSLKSYGTSAHQLQFEKWAAGSETMIIKLLQKYSYGPVNIFIDCPTKYPQKSDWELLNAHLDHCFKVKRNDPDPLFAIATDRPEWIILIHPLPNDSGMTFHPDHKSYSLIITSPYHKNEKDNLTSKMDDACANLVKHSNVENDTILNFLFLHLPQNASVDHCAKWVQDYFTEYPYKPITGVFLYQPLVASLSLENRSTGIVHYFLPVLKEEKYTGWIPPEFNISITYPVGISSAEPIKNKLIFQRPGGQPEEVILNDRYTYQHGIHYLKMQQTGEGQWTGNLYRVGSGIYSQLVIEIPGQPGKAILGAKQPAFDELLLL